MNEYLFVVTLDQGEDNTTIRLQASSEHAARTKVTDLVRNGFWEDISDSFIPAHRVWDLRLAR